MISKFEYTKNAVAVARKKWQLTLTDVHKSIQNGS